MANVTGRDRHITLKALAIAIRAIDAAPPERQPASDRDDMVRLLKAMAPNEVELEMYVRSAVYVVEGIATPATELR